MKQPDATMARRPKATAGYIIEELDGELLLLHPSSRQILHANETSALVWHLCDGRHTLAEIIDLLCIAYPEASADIPTDVPVILQQFADLGAITWG